MSEQDNVSTPNSQEDEKWGLALSGGGFRASFFHIGVLASLAEQGLLKKIDVISTVSGGSIIGAMYYLRLKKLLEENLDYINGIANSTRHLTNKDYVDLVEELEKDFLKGVQENIRMRVFSNVWHNLKMAKPNYSRSDRISKLYDEYFYGDGRIEMKCLKIQPKGASKSFDPESGNKSRKAKVPILIINATTLNTGHNWRFQASRMGVAPYDDYKNDKILKDWRPDVDKNLSLIRPKSWNDTPSSQEDFTLGEAVAASACVPGLFHPLAISDMYESVKINGDLRDLRVQLVDGGVYDNLGTAGLMYKNCTNYIVSDASGQLKDDPEPSTSLISVISRTNGILMDRVREEELFRLVETKGKDKVTFVHLRKGLPPKEVNYLGNTSRKSKAINSCTTSFDVDCKVQNSLSSIRTDLDTFTDVEANALILDSYLMTEHEFKDGKSLYSHADKDESAQDVEWGFGQLKDIIKVPTSLFKKHLEVGHRGAFKVFWLEPFKAFSLAAVLAAALVAFIYFLVKYPISFLGDIINNLISKWDFLSAKRDWICLKIEQFLAFSLNDLTWEIFLYIIAFLVIIFSPTLSRKINILPRYRKWVEILIHVITRIIGPSIAALAISIHLWIFDWLFKWSGKLEKFVDIQEEEKPEVS